MYSQSIYYIQLHSLFESLFSREAMELFKNPKSSGPSALQPCSPAGCQGLGTRLVLDGYLYCDIFGMQRDELTSFAHTFYARLTVDHI
jgi:hypothetical protein